MYVQQFQEWIEATIERELLAGDNELQCEYEYRQPGFDTGFYTYYLKTIFMLQ